MKNELIKTHFFHLFNLCTNCGIICWSCGKWQQVYINCISGAFYERPVGFVIFSSNCQIL
jgi:hypothetical protein